jgi:hypothetical protein
MNRNADQLTLHEAMAVVLRDRGWVKRDTVALELAEHELYLRPKDGQPPPSWQLGMRVRKYRDWFEARGPSGAQIRLVPGGPGEAVDSPVPARTTRRRSSPGSSGQISASASPTSADTKKAREQRARAARKYKPANIKTLLVAEAPPSSTERYFYFEGLLTIAFDEIVGHGEIVIATADGAGFPRQLASPARSGSGPCQRRSPGGGEPPWRRRARVRP